MRSKRPLASDYIGLLTETALACSTKAVPPGEVPLATTVLLNEHLSDSAAVFTEGLGGVVFRVIEYGQAKEVGQGSKSEVREPSGGC